MNKLFFSLLSCFQILLSNLSNAQEINYKLFPDGTFEIIGKSVCLKKCYPAIDNIPLHPTKVIVSSSVIEYSLSNGKLSLMFGKENGYVTLKTETTLPQDLANIISPVFCASVEGATSFYRTAGGIMGDGGVFKWTESKTETSTLLTGLLPDSGNSLFISTHDVRKYKSYSDLKKDGNEKKITINIQIEKVAPTNLPKIFISENQNPYAGMRTEATAIAKEMNARNSKPQAYLWCSWYYSYNYLTDEMLAGFLKGFETISPRIPLQTIQIDEGYQPHIGDWLLPSRKFPKGLEPSVKEILAKGYKAGIWIAPFLVGNRSELFINHPDWVLKWGDSTKVGFFKFYDEQRLFGALDEEYYTLDTSNPEVMEYLRQVFREYRKMGITYFKTDFMMWGDQQSQNLKRKVSGKTSIEYQREFFEMIRTEIGEESFWLGCIATYPSFIGYVDGMRISADITAKWEGAESMFKESVGNQHINNVWWQNDPDAMILRSKFNRMTDTDAKSINLWMGLLGGMVNTSEALHELPSDRLAMFRAFEPGKNKTTATFPFLTKNEPLDILCKEIGKDTWAVMFLNRKENSFNGSYTISSLVNKPKLFVSEWNMGKIKDLGENTSINIDLKSHESKVFYFSTDKDAANKTSLGGAVSGK